MMSFSLIHNNTCSRTDTGTNSQKNSLLFLILLTFFVPVAAQYKQTDFLIGAYEAPPLFISDVSVAIGDYNGDGRADLSTKTNTGPQKGKWRVEYGTNSKGFQQSGWLNTSASLYGNLANSVVPGDYDGDGKTDFAVCNSTGDWKITFSSNSTTIIYKTKRNAISTPVVGDFDGNGCSDISYYDKGSWIYSPSPARGVLRTGTTITINNWKNIAEKIGTKSSHPVPADYDGDKITDASVKTDGTATAEGNWIIKYSSTGKTKTFKLLNESGQNNADLATALPASADYNGDGVEDLGVKTDEGKWYVLNSPTINIAVNSSWSLVATEHGRGSGFKPIPANYEKGDKKADIAIFDPRTGIFHIDFSSNQIGSWDFATLEGKGGDDFNTSSLNEADISNLSKLRDANFNLIVSDTYYKGTRQKDYYLALLHKVGLNTIFADQNITGRPLDVNYGNLFLNHLNTLQQSFREHILAFDLGDEPTGCQSEQVKAWANFFFMSKLNTTNIPVFYNLLPTYATPTLYSATCNTNGTYGNYLNLFISSNTKNFSPFVSFDHYPFGPNKLFRNDYFLNLKLIKDKARLEGDKPVWATIGVNSKLLERELSYSELKFSAFTPLTYGAKGIMYFTYHNFIDTDEKTYKNVQAVNRYIKDIVGPVLMKADNIATLHKENTDLNGQHKLGAEEIVSTNFTKNKGLVKDIAHRDIVVGVFRNKSMAANAAGAYHLFIVNKKTNPAETISNTTLTLNGNFSNRVKIAPSCDEYSLHLKKEYSSVKTTYNAAENTTILTIQKIAPGDGLLVTF
jgi:hypothetical protein